MATEWFAALRQETEHLRAFMPEDLPSGSAAIGGSFNFHSPPARRVSWCAIGHGTRWG